MARSLARPSSESVTLTLEETYPSPPAAPAGAAETLVLRLKRRANKKVTWKEGTVDNEFLNRKSSKSCCIFHKEKPFDEDDSDDDGGHDHCHGGGSDGGAGPSGCCSRPSD